MCVLGVTSSPRARRKAWYSMHALCSLVVGSQTVDLEGDATQVKIAQVVPVDSNWSPLNWFMVKFPVGTGTSWHHSLLGPVGTSLNWDQLVPAAA